MNIKNREAGIKRGLMATVLCIALVACFLSGCSSQEPGDQQSKEADNAAPFENETLQIYCGAGMTDPFQEIADAFSEKTGCTMDVTFANAAQTQTQINTAQEGDFFIAGSVEELSPVEEYVVSSTDLVKHIPVLAVPADNPKNITSLDSLTEANVVLIGDPEATPIGKIAKKALTDAGLWEELSASDVITTTTTAPQIATALKNNEGDVGIVWKENASANDVMIVDTADLDAYVKTVPVAVLSFTTNQALVDAFNEFLQSDTSWDIWERYGYERA